MSETVHDWTRGDGGFWFQECQSCGNRWYFARPFCPACGSTGPTDRAASGAGTIHAITVVHRPPAPEWQPYVPYALALVALDDGVRVMGHADVALGIGDRVEARFEHRAGHQVPVFTRGNG